MNDKRASFNDFIAANPNCQKFGGNPEAILFFEFLSADASIIKMIEASDSGKPALSPVAKDIEKLFDSFSAPTISLKDSFTKQAVGLMIKCILEPFGYVVAEQKNLPKSSGAKYFRSASCYRFDENAPATLKIVKKIETI
ncbi:MAG: hypothetical protein ACI4J5_06540 [Oscillospiraceae bacterium]